MKMKENVVAIKSKAFAIRIIKFSTHLQKEKGEYVLSSQILRSGTSIGANTRESKNAQSMADFINKLSVALKEADETAYWLELLYNCSFLTENQYNSMKKDCMELMAMLSSSIRSCEK